MSNAQLFPGYTERVDTSGTRWLSADEQVTWRAFVGSCHAFFAAIDTQLQRDAGMPLAYYEILVRLSEAPDRQLRMTQLAEATAASKSRASHAVARLEERGWVRRRDCPTDRRGQLAELTDEGYAVLAAAAPGHVEQVRRTLFDPLTPEQVQQVTAISTAIMAAVGSPQPCEPPCEEDGASCLGPAP
jgi:DNA-binding MarR family transcriptional regulator